MDKKYLLPYHEGIKKYLEEKRIPFHMPGHKNKFIKSGIELNILPKNLHQYDITPSYEREDLYNPKTFLKESLINLREIYKTEQSFYLVNGSTGGNQAALLATLGPGDKILLPRQVHRLIYGALVASQACPIYLEASCSNNNPLLSGIDPVKLENTLKKDPDIKVVYLVYPTYTGICSDIIQIINISKKYNKIVIVDEAHGAHFCFHPELPVSAVEAKADLVVQSTHKTLNALSQTSLLHINGNNVNKSRVEMTIGMFQTSSPNTLLLLSLEACVVQMANQGKILLDKTLKLARQARKAINKIPLLHCYGNELINTSHIFNYDETKLYVDVSQTGLTGNEVKSILGKKYKVEAELSDNKSILFALTISDTAQDIKRLIYGLQQTIQDLKNSARFSVTEELSFPALATETHLTPAEVFFAKQKAVPLIESEGHICAEMIIPYPPGIPILMPGEMIKNDIIDYIKYLQHIHSTFSGSTYADLSKIMVVDNYSLPT